jgi:hypothetical protein
LVGIGGTTISAVVIVDFCAVAVMLAQICADTGDVVIVKLADVLPGSTVTVDRTTALELSEANETTTPPEGAGTASVTVPVDEVPPGTGSGLAVRPARNGVPIA